MVSGPIAPFLLESLAHYEELKALKADSYEVRNLAAPAGSPLIKRLESELARQKAAVAYTNPSYADPDQFGQAEPKKRDRKEGKVGAE